MKFNKTEYYPTPKELVSKMVDGIDFAKCATILEPSAGTGHIVDVIKNKMEQRRYQADIDCIEVDPELRSILKDKNFRVIHDDFLTFHTFKEYDLIVMNPPFSNGEQHLLKALKLQKSGGHIICLLNAETLNNPFTLARKELLRVLEEKTDYSCEILSNSFSSSEHQTNVDVALLKISVKEEEKFSYFREELRHARAQKEAQSEEKNFIAENDLISQIVKQYDFEVELRTKLIREFHAAKPYILRSFDNPNTAAFRLVGSNDTRYSDLTVNEDIKAVRRKYWETLFAHKSFIERLTSSMRQDLYSRIDELVDFDFSYFNIKQLQLEMTQNIVGNLEKTALDIFDKLSHQYSYESYSKNVHYYNGWKTNKSWFVNKKVILPFSGFSRWGDANLDRYTISATFNDIEKALNLFNGNKTLTIDLGEAIEKAVEVGQTKNIEFNFFDVTFYKKGTAHIVFKNMDVLKRLNIFAGQKKAWLPPVYGKKAYQEMSPEEKAVIDDFEGEESYREVFSQPEHWLMESSSLLSIPSSLETVTH
ncbi:MULTISPECIES: class I SAM-dependent methyltransferase [Lactococcus]|jgi:hypothetical protein|uniref:DUF4942 domain-containing protein n=1 Tax=Lactococcus formosensis TaxID=1281486 RepID=A0A9Q9D7Q9_9LACT|nr:MULTISPECIES: DUF4942 domain-containing protein [Lactococcus]USI66560.1 DUF4942 domain-containing protein [Lactococcus petauri]USI69002.1 DUF4942 domain-containing protein [Lactococcus petauri]USJ21191.1 DUF4942 domain-containing protein [Lactococcus formosensis]WJE13671.1 DUF4942 domain-containing protein [Lactococcus petauri]